MAGRNFKEGVKLPTVIEHFKNILEQYPDDGQILKELIQNADDARASTIKFLWDETQYGTKKLFNEKNMAKYQGPALLAYNDAPFGEKDWEGIRKISNSVKKDDPLKVGRFGLGFKSVFHITDVASFVTGNDIACIDPHERLYCEELDEGTKTSSYNWNMVEDKEKMSDFSEQWEPYFHKIFDFTKREFDLGRYDHTLFRFPFRQKDSKSKLSSKVYDADKMSKLIHSIEVEGHLCLIFLNYLKKIEFYHKSSKETEPVLLYSATASAADRNGQWFQSGTEIERSMSYKLDIKVFSSSSENKEYSYWVNQLMDHEGDLGQIARSLGVLPLVGTALPLNDFNDVSVTNGGGHLFCFLPLPLEKDSPTGLNVHVNGYFALDQNRRHLKLPSAEMRVVTEEQLRWNVLLIERLVPKSMVDLVTTFAQKRAKDANFREKTLQLLPCSQGMKINWEGVVGRFYEIAKPLPIFPTLKSNLVAFNKAIFMADFESGSLEGLLSRVVAVAGYEVVSVTSSLLQDLQTHLGVILMTPDIAATAYKTVQTTMSLTGPEKLQLLEYIWTVWNPSKIFGLDLLFCGDGIWRPFSSCVSMHQTDLVYVDLTEDVMGTTPLLPGCEGKFLKGQDIDAWGKMQLMTSIAGSGTTNLTVFGKLNFATAFRQQFLQDPASLITKRPSTLSDAFYKKLWTYLGSKFSQANDLQPFESLRIIPISKTDQVIQLTKDTAIKIKGNSASDTLLQAVGVTIINDIPEYVKNHPQIRDRYILNPESVAQSVHSVRAGLTWNISRFDSNTKRQWRNLFAQLNPHEKNLLRETIQQSVIFETVYKSGGVVSTFVSAQQVPKAMKGLSNLPAALPHQVIDMSDKDSEILAVFLGIKQLSLSVALKEEVLPKLFYPNYSSEEIEKVAKFCLDKNSELKSCAGFWNTLSNVAFVNTASDVLKRPVDLLDPADNVNASLFGGMDDKFPKGTFFANSYLGHLRDLGLRSSKSISDEELRSVAEHISRNRTSTTIREQAKNLVKFFEGNPGRYRNIEDIEHQHLAWIPVEQKPPSSYPPGLAWLGSMTITASLQELAYDSYALLCGSTKFVCKQSYFLHVPEPDMGTVLQHFEDVIDSFDQATEQDRSKYSQVVLKMYEYLSKNSQQAKERIARRQLTNWVWTGSVFTNLDRVSIEGNANLAPYHYCLPAETKRFAQFFKEMGCLNQLDQGTITDILQKVHSDHEDEALNPETLEVAKHAISILVNMIQSNKTSIADQEVYVPDENSMMTRASDLCYNFDPLIERMHTVRYCHPSVPLEHALLVGVKTDRQAFLHQNSIGLPFGQHEKLVNRLKRILQGYPAGSTIFKELIQNADDAKATEIHFIVDEQTHGKTKLFSSGWQDLQGPALLVYNDMPFTMEDIKGIQNLGEGSKSDDPSKTGQYGVGFNAVYHITDTPTFMTKVDQGPICLCAFDPLLKSVEGATKEMPGMMIDVAKVSGNFPDVFSPYDKVWEVVDSNREGTLFRFPLRSAPSEMNKVTYDVATITDHFDRAEMNEALLFTRNLRKISFSTVTKDKGLSQLFSVSSNIDQDGSKKLKEFSQSIKDQMEECKTSNHFSLNEISLRKVEYELEMTSESFNKDREIKTQRQKWIVIQQYGFSSPDQLSDGLRVSWNSRDLALAPLGGLACPLGDFFTRKKLFCFLPLPQITSLMFHVNGHFALNYETRDCLISSLKNERLAEWNDAIFRQIVAPCVISLLEIQRNKLTILFDDKQPVSSEMKEVGTNKELEKSLNKYLALFPCQLFDTDLVVAVTKAVYRLMLEEKKELLPMLLQKELKFLPPNCLHRKPVFDTLPSNHLFEGEGDEKDSDGDKQQLKSDSAVRNVLKAFGMNLLVPSRKMQQILSCFPKAEISTLSPELAFEHLKTAHGTFINLPCPLEQTPFKCTEHLLAICKYIMEHVYHTRLNAAAAAAIAQTPGVVPVSQENMLNGLPLLLSGNDTLHEIGTNVLVASPFYYLFPNSKQHFLHHKLLNIFSQELGPVKNIDINDLEKFLASDTEKAFLKESDGYIAAQTVDGTIKTESKGVISLDWFRNLWRCLDSIIKKETKILITRGQTLPENFLHPIRDWALFPASKNERSLLVPLEKASCVPHSLYWINEGAQEAIFKYSLLQEHFAFFQVDPKITLYHGLPDCYLKICGNGRDIRTLIRALQEAMTQEETFTISEQTSTSARALLRHFASDVTTLNEDKAGLWSARSVIKGLRVFPSSTGLIALDDHNVVVLPSEMKLDVDNNSNQVFLPYDYFLEELYAFLDVRTMTVRELYEKVILPEFENLDRKEQLEHLKFLSEHLIEPSLSLQPEKETPEQYNFLEILATHRLFYSNDNYVLANSLFGPRNKVFQCFRPDNLVPKEYQRDSHLLVLLKRLGLNDKVTDNHILTFAREVKAGAVVPFANLEDVKAKATVLIKHVLEMDDLSDHLAWQLREVEFFPSHEPDLKLALGIEGPSFTKSSGSVCLTSSVLPWSKCSILAQLPSAETQTFQKLGIVTNVNESVIAHHLKYIVDSSKGRTASDRATHLLIEEINAIVSHLKRTNSSCVAFREIAFLPLQIGNKMQFAIPTNLLMVHLSQEETVFPYLVSLDDLCDDFDKYAFKQIGEKMGCHAEKLPECFLHVLNRIAEESLAQALDPNEMEAAVTAYRLMMQTLKTKPFASDPNEVHFMGMDNFMHLSINMFFPDEPVNDAKALSKFDQPFIRLPEFDMTRQDQKKLLKTRLPAKLMPKFVSEVLEQKIIEPIELARSNPISEELLSKLRHRRFGYALTLIGIKYSDLDDTELTEVITEVQNIRVLTVRNLTKNWVKDNVVVSSKIVDYFFADETLYVNESFEDIHEIQFELQDVIAKMLGVRPEGEKSLLQVLVIDSDAIQRFVDSKLDPPPPDFVYQHVILGSPVPKNRLLLLQQDIAMEGLLVREYVAVQINLENDEGEVVPTFIYGRIASDVQKTESFDDQYLVDTGEAAPVTFSVLDIFRFKRSPKSVISEDISVIKDRVRELIQKVYQTGDRTKIEQVLRRLLQQYNPGQYDDEEDKAKAESIVEFIEEVKAFQEKNSTNSVVVDTRYMRQIADFRVREERTNFATSVFYHPNPVSAGLYLRQAIHDLAKMERNMRDNSDWNWACYMGHQAAEKAIKACVCNRIGEDSHSHNLSHLASGEDDQKILEASARSIESITGPHYSLRYPQNSQIPSDKYTRNDAEGVLEHARVIVGRARQIIKQ